MPFLFSAIISLLFISSIYFLDSTFKDSNDFPNENSSLKKWHHIFLLFITLMVAVRVFNSLNEGLSHDSAQHVHIAWLMSKGLIPYRDFFDNHPPLFWIPMFLAFKVYPDPPLAQSIYVAKMTVALTVVILWGLLYETSRQIYKSSSAAILSLGCLIACAPSLDPYFEIRPQQPMLVFFILSILFYVQYSQRPSKTFYLVLSSMSLTFSQLILPMMPLESIALAFFMFFATWKKRSKREALIFLFIPAIFTTIILIFVMCIFVDPIDLYYFVVKLNLTLSPNAVSPRLKFLEAQLHLPIIVFGVVGIFSVLFVRKGASKSFAFVILCLVIISGFNMACLCHSLWPQHYMSFYVLASMLTGCSIFLFAAQSRRRILLFFSLIIVYLFFFASLSRQPRLPSREVYLDNLSYLLSYSSKQDRVFLSPSRHPLFRMDASYYWFGRWDLVRDMQEHIEGFDFLPHKSEIFDVRIPLKIARPKFMIDPDSGWWSLLDRSGLASLPSCSFKKVPIRYYGDVVEFRASCSFSDK
jgi:hypothetical protein